MRAICFIIDFEWFSIYPLSLLQKNHNVPGVTIKATSGGHCRHRVVQRISITPRYKRCILNDISIILGCNSCIYIPPDHSHLTSVFHQRIIQTDFILIRLGSFNNLCQILQLAFCLGTFHKSQVILLQVSLEYSSLVFKFMDHHSNDYIQVKIIGFITLFVLYSFYYSSDLQVPLL